jgi:16S rRNA (cytidine1402-2'-O)-methyltransferase
MRCSQLSTVWAPADIGLYTGPVGVGTLYLVATPIGNLEDITYRAVRTLGDCDVIACEDTRHSRRLLDHCGIGRPLVSYHEHNERDRAAELLARLRRGEKVALISDAGTPLISDPGYRLVHEAAAEGIPVVPVPGASAILTALTASGLPTDSFFFGGFLPPKSSQRQKRLEQLRLLDAVLVFYDAPHRILEALADVGAILGPRSCVLSRELTKMHEEFLRGTPKELLAVLGARESVKGEITLVIGKPVPSELDERPIPEAVEELISAGSPQMEAIKEVARHRGLSKREVYAVYSRR